MQQAASDVAFRCLLSLLNVNDIITSSHKQQRLRHLLHTQSDRRNETAHTASSNASCNETPTNIAQAQHQPEKRATPSASVGGIEARAAERNKSSGALISPLQQATAAKFLQFRNKPEKITRRLVVVVDQPTPSRRTPQQPKIKPPKQTGKSKAADPSRGG